MLLCFKNKYFVDNNFFNIPYNSFRLKAIENPKFCVVKNINKA